MYQGHLAFADNISQKQLYTAALKQSFSLCKGYQKLQLSQAGHVHSLCCKGERSSPGSLSPLCQEPYATGREMWAFPKAAADKVCSGRSGQACWNCLEARIIFWGDPQDRVPPGKSGTVAWAGSPIHARVFRTHHQFQRATLSPKHLCSRERASPSFSQLGNVGTSLLLTYPRLLSQTGAAGSWSGLLIRALITPSNPPCSFKATTSAV